MSITVIEGEPQANAVQMLEALRGAVEVLVELGEGWQLVVGRDRQLRLEGPNGAVMYGGYLPSASVEPTP